jgi:hypothetical protein
MSTGELSWAGIDTTATMRRLAVRLSFARTLGKVFLKLEFILVTLDRGAVYR